MLRRLLMGFTLLTGISAQAYAETVTILMESVPDTEYVKTLVPEFTKETGIEVNLEVVNYAEMHTKLVPQLVLVANTGDDAAFDIHVRMPRDFRAPPGRRIDLHFDVSEIQIFDSLTTRVLPRTATC